MLQEPLDVQTINPEMPEYAALLDPPARYKVLYGGRGAARTWTNGRRAIFKAMEKKRLILCTRELQTSIADSIHRLLVNQIDLLGLNSWFTVTDKEIRCLTGSSFIFKGLRHNTKEIKSIEGIDIALVEEAEKMSDESWETLIPTVRGPDSEIWVNFNPDLETDPTYRRFVTTPPPRSIILKVNHSENPFFPQVLADERDYLKSVDLDAYLHVWEGFPRKNSNAQIFLGKWTIDSFDPVKGEDGVWRINGEEADGPYHGLDFGFSQDPTAGVKVWVVGRKIYIERELWQVKLETVDMADALKRAIPGIENHVVRGDSARPETISHLSKVGNLSVQGVEKGKGSVEDGISFLRSFEKIVIHERCKHMIDEAKNYSFKVDRLTGDITVDIVDKHNHCWDAVRYALQPLIKHSGEGMGLFHVMAARAAKIKEQQNVRKT